MRTTRYLGLFGLVALTACAAPEADVGLLSEQDLPEDRATLEALPGAEAQADKESGGFLSRILGGDKKPKVEDDAELTLAGESEAGQAPDIPEQDEAKLANLTPPETFGVPQRVEPKPAKPRGGFLGGLLSGGNGSKPVTATSDIALGTQLPYGRVARVCGVPKSQLGKRVEQFPEKRAKYALYDSQPGSTALRTFFLTGFDDGCARQFSAAVAVLASASLHEQLRYGLPAEVQPYSDTDKAYEDLKVRVCKVPRRKPCGSRIGRLENNTVFVSIYERFGGNAQWSNLLVYDGALLAQDKKGL